MSIKIIKAGLQATIQDGGRNGYRSIGISTGGAMDNFAFAVANFLTGNNEDRPVIEINFPAPEILFEKDALISITGADFTALADDVSAPLWKPLLIKKNTILRFAKSIKGAKGYIAIHKGWQAKKWLGSYSTHIKLQAGGYKGRPLQEDDGIEFQDLFFSFKTTKNLPWQVSVTEIDKIYSPQTVIDCVQSSEWGWLTGEAMKLFNEQTFTLSGNADRMGYRFNNSPLQLVNKEELISSPVDDGIIQLLPDGNVIVLMADSQVTGGYPRIAAVAKTALPKLAQIKPCEKINFNIISLQAAEEKLLEYQQLKTEIKAASYMQLQKLIKL